MKSEREKRISLEWLVTIACTLAMGSATAFVFSIESVNPTVGFGLNWKVWLSFPIVSWLTLWGCRSLFFSSGSSESASDCTATIRIPYPVASLENVTVSDRPKSVIYCLFSCRGYCRSGRRSRCERSDASAEPSTAGGIQPVTAPTFSTFSVPPRMRFRAMLRRHSPTRRCNVLNILS